MRNIIRFLAVSALVILLSQAQLFAHSSSTLKANIMNHLDWEYPHQISITVQDGGMVTLKGAVKTYWDWRNIFAITSRVPGVQEIKNEILVETDPRPDQAIRDEIVHYLTMVKTIDDPDRIEVKVTGGLVILRGTADSGRQAEIIEDVASWHQGVKSVANEIRVLPPREAGSDANLTSILHDLIVRDFPLERRTVQVQVMDGKAVLSGTVTSLWASREIEKEVRRIQGIASVANALKHHSAS
ncbi:MAG: BON domain-containing protein [bacterium]